jgi:hypothetical protein
MVGQSAISLCGLLVLWSRSIVGEKIGETSKLGK